MRLLDKRLAELRQAGRVSDRAGSNIGSIAIQRTAVEPDRVVVIDGDRRVTRAEMLDAALRLGGALRVKGIEAGAVVSFQLPNWWEACVVNLMAALFGYRLAPLLTIYRAAELETILPACEVEAIFIPESFRGTDYPAMIAGLAAAPKHVFVVRGNPSASNSLELLLETSPGEPSPPDADVKMVLFTSGSTGRPKGVLHSHASFDALIHLARHFWQVGPDDAFFVPSPIGHIGGSMYAFEFPWITGCTAILADRWDANDAVRRIDDLGASFMAGATPFLADLVAAAERAGTRLPRFRRFICGGASVPPELVRRGLQQFEKAIVSRAYGSTEVPVACPGIRTRVEAEARTETDGECVAEIRIVDDAGQPVAEGESGEILVKAPQMFLGYLDPADEAGCFAPDGFFRMGDIGRRVDGRFIEITGRKKDIIIRKGENISPLEIENALARHESVRQSAVVGVPDRERGEMVMAFVLPVEGRSFTLTDMTSHLTRLGLARQKIPERLEIVTALPMNAVGKVQKPELRVRAAMTAEASR